MESVLNRQDQAEDRLSGMNIRYRKYYTQTVIKKKDKQI
jgi:hypothetical protein